MLFYKEIFCQLRAPWFYGLIFILYSLANLVSANYHIAREKEIFRRAKQINYLSETITKAPEFINMEDCFVWWQAFIGDKLPFHHTVKRLIREGKLPEGKELVWYAASLILSNMTNPQALTEEEKSLLREIDESINRNLIELAERMGAIDAAIMEGIMEGYQEAMTANMTDAMFLGEAIPPELSQELIRALRGGSWEAKKKAVQEVLRYMVDCAKASQEKFKEDFTKIVNEALGEALDRMGEGEIAIDDLYTIKEMIKARIKAQMQRKWQMQAAVVQGELEKVRDGLYIDSRIQSIFPFLPLLVKAVLSQEPSLLSDVNIQRNIREFMKIGMGMSWLTQIAENGSLSYRGSIALSPVLKIHFIYRGVEETLEANGVLHSKIESSMNGDR